MEGISPGMGTQSPLSRAGNAGVGLSSDPLSCVMVSSMPNQGGGVYGEGDYSPIAALICLSRFRKPRR